MTNIAVFLPIANMSSLIGQFFKEFALTVTFATIFSLLISFTLTPMLASLILPENGKKRWRISDRLENAFNRLEAWYQRLLTRVLHSKKRAVVVLLTVLALFAASLPLGGMVGFEFFPMMDEGDIRIEVELPLGYNLDETAHLLQTVEDRLRRHESVRHFLTTLGTISDINTGSNVAVMMVKLVDADRRDRVTTEIAGQFIEELSDIPNARIRVAAVSSMGGGHDAPLVFALLGQDVDRLERYKDQILERIGDVDGLVNLNTSSRAGKPEISITPDRVALADAGLTVYDLALAVRGALTGLVTTQYKEEGEEYDLRVMLQDAAVDSPEEVGNITIVGPAAQYRLDQLADINFAEGFSTIMHQDKYKAIEISGATAPGVPLGDVVAAVNERLADVDLPEGYRIDWGGDAEMMQDTALDMLGTFALALVLTYMLLAAILESLTQPLLILGTVPLAFIGVFAGLLVTGKTMNVVSMMAIVMLLGIVVNNAILLLDYTNILVRQRGRDVRSALLEACPTKLKPILMSTIAIILGMLPMALGFGDAGREVRQPMGIVSIGGLVVSAVLTLIVIPALYYLATKSRRSDPASTTSK